MDSLGLDAESQSVAIIGMAVRFPGAPDLETFWRNLRDGVESIRHFSDEELAASGVDKATLADPNYVKATATIPEIDLFDAGYFNFSPKEVEFIDPQQRIFLECSLHALESSGCDPSRYRGSIGVFAGSGVNTYQVSLISAHMREIRSSGVLRQLFVHGNDKDHLTTRASYKLNLRGPSMAVQTACSTSLVAVHMATQSVLSGECDVALAGGVSVMSSYRKGGYYYVQGGILSPDGRCRPFDAGARGTVFGDGVGIVVLKRLEQALADRDQIHAVIRGSAINNDGSGKVGYTAPSVNGQAAVIAEALAVAGVGADSISYIEAHGTGTELGDPIEIAALAEVFGTRTRDRQSCAIGSVKANVGHLNTVAGVAGLIKTVLALKHGYMPPSLNFSQPNPKIDFANSPFRVNTALMPWPSLDGPRRAGVSSFGIGGTNAHVVVEEAPVVYDLPSDRSWHVLTLSGRSEAVLERATENMIAHLRVHAEQNIADVAYSMSAGRRNYRYGRAIVCRNSGDAADLLQARDPKLVFSGDRGGQEKPVVFMFPGQGSQRLHAGRELYRQEPVFRKEIDRCADLLLERGMQTDLRELLYPRAGDEIAAAGRLTETEFAQPVIFVVSFALARLWQSWGVNPRALIGHSIGELVAACLADVFSLEDALTVVLARGRLMQAMPHGAMLGISASLAEVQPHLNDGLFLAAVNAPEACSVSGSLEAIGELEQKLRHERIPASRLRTSHAFHSPHMLPAVDPFVRLVETLELKVPSIPFASNVTGTWIKPEEATDPSYWGRQLLQTVRFSDGLRTVAQGDSVLLEVGTGRTLASFAPLCVADPARVMAFASLPHSSGKGSEMETLLQAAAQLWCACVPLDWSSLYQGEQRKKVTLPLYPFERTRYWVEPNGRAREAEPAVPKLDDAMHVRSWRRVMLDSAGWQADDLANTNWLVFSAGDSFSQHLVDTVRPRCQHLTVVSMGDRFTALDDELTLSSALPKHFEDAIATLKSAARVPHVIVYLWTMVRQRPGLSNLARDTDNAFSGPLHLVQALERADLGHPVELAILTVNTEDVLGDEPILPRSAIARGPCHVTNLECRNVRARYVDLSLKECSSAARAGIVERLVGEMANPAADTIIAYRHGRAWLAKLEKVKLPSVQPETVLRRNGVYLITGGTGGIGLALAEVLGQAVQAKLVLTGRTALPARDQWDRVLSEANEADKAAALIRSIKKIELTGGEVLLAAADVSDSSAMRNVVDQARKRFGEINGVVHAAGMGSGQPIAFASRASCLSILDPKVRGTLVLDRVLGDLDLDFLVLFSSISALEGFLGHVDYSAANAFLDAFARSSAGRVRKTVAINWDLWNETGMAVRKHVPAQLRAAHDVEMRRGIRTDEGIDALFRILGSGLSQVLVSKRRSSEARRDVAEPVAKPETPQEAQRMPEKLAINRRYPRPDLPQPYAAPATELEQIIAEMWEEVLNLEQIGINDDFFELGGHSLLALQFLPRLRSRFQVELTPRDFFASSTVAAVALVVEEKLIAEIEQMGEAEIAEAGE